MTLTGCLMLHGFTGSPDELAPLAAHLSSRTDWEVAVPVLPGHGGDGDLADVSHEEWLQAAEQELLALKKRHATVHLVGFSMGGLLASCLAAQFDPGKLVLLAAAGKILAPLQLSREIARICFDALTGQLEMNEFYNRMKTKSGAVSWHANREFFAVLKRARKEMKRVRAPVLIAQGRLDGIVPARTATYLEEELASEEKEVVLFDSSRHFICLEDDRDTVNRLVLDFLQKES